MVCGTAFGMRFDQGMPTGSDSAKRLGCAGSPALLDALPTESGSQLPHSKRFAPAAARAVSILQ
jgi:hypothetical protein